jgi:hypothetical protein
MIKEYKVGIYEEIGGTIVVKAESKEQAEEIADGMLNEYGCDRLFYPVSGVYDDLYPYKGRHYHGDREVTFSDLLIREK